MLMCGRQSFWGRIGHALEPDSLSEGPTRLAALVCKEIATETGNGPASDKHVLQRLRHWKYLGRTTQEQIAEVEDLLDRASEEASDWPEEAVVAEARKVLKPRLEQQALIKGYNEWSARGDLVPIGEEIIQASRVGIADMAIGTVWGADAIVPAYREGALRTGVDPLDDALGGGTFRGELCIVAGDTGHGKSIFLTQVTAEAALQQKLAAYVTLEVGANVIGRRLASNITALPYSSIKSGDAIERAKEIIQGKRLVQPVIKEFAAKATTVSDVIAWIKYAEGQQKRPFDLLVVDMADHLIPPKGVADDYKGVGAVYAALRELAKDRDKWLWTASHTKARADKQKHIDAGGLSDSRNKGRLADTLVTLGYDDDTKDVDIYLAKGRDIEGAKLVARLPTDFATSMIVRVSRIGVGE